MKFLSLRQAIPFIALALITTGYCQLPSVYKDPNAPVEKRVEDLLSQLTPEEKIDMLSGASGMVFRGNNRLGIPFFKLSDGSIGIRCYGPSTAYPNGVALACTWDVGQAERSGIAMGRDSRARGVNVILGPGMNLDRAPMCGRNAE